MPKPGDRRKKRKFASAPKSKNKMRFSRKKHSKKKCALCAKGLHGMPHGKTSREQRAMAKTKRRPSAPFAGTLCGKCRKLIFEEAIKEHTGAKERGETEPGHREYIAVARAKIKQ